MYYVNSGGNKVKQVTNLANNTLNRVGNQRHLRAIHEGIVAILPLIIVSSFLLFLIATPFPKIESNTPFLLSKRELFESPYQLSLLLIPLYLAFSIGGNLANRYELNSIEGGIISALAFLLTNQASVVNSNQGKEFFSLTITNFGSVNIFTSIITAVVAIEIYRWGNKKSFNRSNISIPPAVIAFFEKLLPTFLVVVLMVALTYIFKVKWFLWLNKLLMPIFMFSNSLWGVLLIVCMITLCWFFGIHGISVIGILFRPFWLQMFLDNSNALLHGQHIQNIAVEPFYQWFIWIGGSGCTLGLVLLLRFFCHSMYAKKIGRETLVPSLFNINEAVIFGTPIVMNPILGIPFVLSPIACALIAWVATKMMLINPIIIMVPWCIPSPIGAFIATGGDWRASLLCISLIIVSGLIYYPFIKKYDRYLVQSSLEN